jgi:KaiC/GvpD/RAD55 family RecA-like ATPase
MSIGTQDAVDVSYLSDTIVALSFFETEGRLRRAITVVKKKHSAHSMAIHELTLADGRIDVGEPMLTRHPNLFIASGAADKRR